MSELSGARYRLPMELFPPTPAGLDAIYSLCRKIYPDQVNPLQVTALVKYWLGGPDPLDYISMYSNPGVPEKNIPPHWHYISFGLSDLHGDGRVHDITGPESPSGFGFELTFRLKREPGETAPPTWPATVMQSLAKYVFQSDNVLCAGDHVSWHCALDGSESRIQHMLMTQDPQLGSIRTPYGSVNFVQIVGVTAEELQAAQQWNGPGVLDILKRLPGAGSQWLVTDMRRGESMQEIDLAAQEEVDQGVEKDGSNLSGVSARCSWTDVNMQNLIHHIVGNRNEETEELLPEDGVNRNECSRGQGCVDRPSISEKDSQLIKAALRKGLLSTKIGKSLDLDDNDNVCKKELTGTTSNGDADILESTELLRTRKLEGLHLTFNLEAGELLPLAIRGRVKHGRHFTFKSMMGDTAITFVAPTVTGTLVDDDNPYVAHGPWLQVLIPDELADEMSESFEIFSNRGMLELPKTFLWPHHNLAITIVEDKPHI
ncbi:suppressor of fused homolog [Schistocerca nitens]|uniref:suppressor of fused homolog n=1 Tax=Schistocerca nitens TaxID=7011 RepID=UPI0021182B2B|nr:suppressor of fused homolog [Schistocerca nitens]